MSPGPARRRPPRTLTAGFWAGAAVLLLLLAACGQTVPREAVDAHPRYDPPLAAPRIPASAIPPTLRPEPLWTAPFSTEPKGAGHGFVGIAMPEEGRSDLLFLGVDRDGATRWSTPRNPSCTAFAVTRDADGRELAVLLDSDADTARGLLATRTTAAAYDPRDGVKVWGPVEVPGTLVGPGLVFAAVPHTVMSGQTGPRVALSASTGAVAADEEAGDRVLHEHHGALLVRRDGRLRAVDTRTGQQLWDSRDLPVPENLRSGAARPLVEYGPRPVTDSSGAVALEWRSPDGGERAYTINDLRTGARLAELSARERPRLVGGPDGETAVSGARPGAGHSGVLMVAASAEPRVLWSGRRSGGAPVPERIVAGVLYLSAESGARAVDARTGQDRGDGTWPVPVAATGDGSVALLPVESPGPEEEFAALPTAPP